MKAYLSVVRCRYKMYAPSSGTHERQGEELPEVISSRGWRHQQLIYLPHIINCLLFMRSSPHLTSPHLTSHSTSLFFFSSRSALLIMIPLLRRFSLLQRKGGKWTKRRRDGRAPEIVFRQEVVVYSRATWHPWRRVVDWRCYVDIPTYRILLLWWVQENKYNNKKYDKEWAYEDPEPNTAIIAQGRGHASRAHR